MADLPDAAAHAALDAIRERLAGVPDPVGLLAGFFALAPVGLQIYDADGTSVLTNAAFRELFGSEPPPGYNVLRDEVAERTGVASLIRRAFQGETVRLPLTWYDPRDVEHVSVEHGRRVAVEPTFLPLLDAAGNVMNVAVLFRDVTAHTRAQARLRAHEAVSRVLAGAEAVDDVVRIVLAEAGGALGWQCGAFWSLRGERLELTDSWCTTPGAEEFAQGSRGYSFRIGEGLPGRALAAMQPVWIEDAIVEPNFPRAPLARSAGFKTAFAFPVEVAGQPFGVFEFFDRDSHPKDLDLLAMMDTLGRQIGQFIVRARARDAVRRSEAIKTAILETALDCVIVMDENGRVVDFNAAATRTFGWERDEAVGREMAELVIPPAYRERHRAGVRRFVATGSGPLTGRRIEMTAMRRDGTEFPVELAITHLVVDGRFLFTGQIRDITERRRQEARLQELHDRAEEANRLKDEFLATVSHELRTPLQAILGWAHILSTSELPPERRSRAAQTIERSARAQARLVEDLLDVSRIVTGKLTIVPVPMDFSDVLRLAVENARHAADEKGITLQLSVSSFPAFVRGDVDRLQQVAWNLLSNAVKFTPAGGVITVAIGCEGKGAVFTVADTGQGIDPKFLPHVFEPFRQADASSTRQHGGLGLGLAIVRRIVDLHGGAVSAHSDGIGKGSTFRVELPLLDASSVKSYSATTPAGERASARLDGCRVLLVDDNRDGRELVAEFLSKSGASVCQAESAEDALRVLSAEARTPDILLCDIAMPGATGYDLLQALRARGYRMPAAALTAHTRPEDQGRAIAAGFHVHLAKPVDIDTLIDTVARLRDASPT